MFVFMCFVLCMDMFIFLNVPHIIAHLSEQVASPHFHCLCCPSSALSFSIQNIALSPCSQHVATYFLNLYNLWLFEWGNLCQVHHKHRHYGCGAGLFGCLWRLASRNEPPYRSVQAKGWLLEPLSSIFHNKNIYIYRMHFSLQML